MSDRFLPMVTLRNVTVMPGMLIHFDVAKKKSIAAIEAAMKNDQTVFLVAERLPYTEDPDISNVFSIGTIASVKQFVKLPGDVVRVLVEGRQRAQLVSLRKAPDFDTAGVTELEDEETVLSPAEEEAMHRALREIIESYVSVNEALNKDVARQLAVDKSLPALLAQATVQIPMTVDQHQELLEARSMRERYERLLNILASEIEVQKLRRDIQEKVKVRLDKNQKDFILREQIKVIREELGDSSDSSSDADEYAEKAEALEAPEYVKERIKKEIARFRNIMGSSSESAVSRGYIETLLSLPWDHRSEDREDLVLAKEILDRDHYGLSKVKERILEFLAVRTLTGKGESPIICLVGPPGTGKTSIARSVAEALNKKYVRICLGGVRDEAEIRGHRRTYVGALPGRIIAGMKEAGVKNPLMLLDEIDKMSSDYKGDTASAMLEVLDGEQNSRFVDHYVEIPVDLSEVMFVCTANSTETIPRPLLDRMELIELSSYTSNEKFHIAKEHLLGKQLERNGLSEKQLSVTDDALRMIISGYTREAGVRSLERKVAEVARKTARKLLEQGFDPEHPGRMKVKVTEKNLTDFLGIIRYSKEKKLDAPEVGVVRGLAWTSAGGDTLSIETAVCPGKGAVELTGKLGDVMKESAKTALSYVKTVSEKYSVDPDFFEKHDFHIHIPEGAVPKDGPSAGITMATAILSAVTGKRVKSDVAMTGEITLRGRVLPIGGLKEKLLAAKAADITTVLVPLKNTKDVDELDKEVTDGLKIRFVASMDEVIKYAFAD